MSSGEHIVEVVDLTGGYGTTTVFQGVGFHVERGEIVALLGQNGSGKSTLLKTIIGVLPPIAGQARLATLNGWESLPPHLLVRSGITYCPQGGLVIPELTVGEHLQLGTQNHAKADASEVLAEAVEVFPALNALLGQRAGTLSGGQRQQLTLSILLAHRSKLWLLDEPTAGLAPEMVKITQAFLRDHVKKHNTTIILVEHNLDVTLALADRILVLREGHVVRTIDNVQAVKDQLNHEQIYY